MADSRPSGRRPDSAAATTGWPLFPAVGKLRRASSLALTLAAVLALASTAVPAAESDLTVEAGVAHDSNPFKTPSDSYFDQDADPNDDPNDTFVKHPAQSRGFYLPITVDGELLVPDGKHRFLLDYRLRHHEYEQDVSNADETYLRVSPGYLFETERRGGTDLAFSVVPFLRYSREIYFDRDTGIGQEISLEDASNRYTYLATGGDAEFSTEIGRRLEWEVSAGFERRDYEDVPDISSLDHDRLEAVTELEIDLSRRLRVYLDYTYRLLDYKDRPARDLDGDIASEEIRRYGYDFAGATLRFRPTSSWSFYFDVDSIRRTDKFAGYNDYDLLGGRVRALWSGARSRVRVAVRYRERDYPRAFIFDDDVNETTGRPNPHKAYDIFDADLLFERAFTGTASWFVEADLRQQNAADPRFTYEALSLAAGVRWELETPFD